MDNTAGKPTSPLIRRFLLKALGLAWLLGGLLMLQPEKFSQNFIADVLSPSLNSQPGWLHALVAFGIAVYSINVVGAAVMAIIIQLGTGILLFSEKPMNVKIGLYLSLIWGLTVWIFGEGMGGLFTGSASLYTGAPGPAFIYVLLSAALLVPISEKITAKLFLNIAGGLLTFFSLLQMQSIFWTAAGIQSILQASSTDAVHFIAGFPMFMSSLLAINPISSNLLLVLLPLGLGLGLLFKTNRFMASATIVFLFLVWWLGQDFGNLSTVTIGTMTDPNTAPLLMLFLMPIFFASPTVEGSPQPLSVRLESIQKNKIANLVILCSMAVGLVFGLRYAFFIYSNSSSSRQRHGFHDSKFCESCG